MFCGSGYNSNSHQPLLVYLRLDTRSHRELAGSKEMKAFAIVKLREPQCLSWSSVLNLLRKHAREVSDNTLSLPVLRSRSWLHAGSCASKTRWSVSCHLHRKAEKSGVEMGPVATLITTFVFIFCLGSMPVRALKSQLFTRRGGSPSSSGVPISYKTLYFDQKVSIIHT